MSVAWGFTARCWIEQHGGHATIFVRAENGTRGTLTNVTATLDAPRTATAELQLSSGPKSRRELICNNGVTFQWRARVRGSGSLDPTAQVTATDAQGKRVSSARVACGRVAALALPVAAGPCPSRSGSGGGAADSGSDIVVSHNGQPVTELVIGAGQTVEVTATRCEAQAGIYAWSSPSDALKLTPPDGQTNRSHPNTIRVEGRRGARVTLRVTHTSSKGEVAAELTVTVIEVRFDPPSLELKEGTIGSAHAVMRPKDAWDLVEFQPSSPTELRMQKESTSFLARDSVTSLLYFEGLRAPHPESKKPPPEIQAVLKKAKRVIASLPVRVTAPPDRVVEVSRLHVFRKDVFIGIGDTVNVTATARPSGGTYSWVSRAPRIATVAFASQQNETSSPNTATISGVAKGTTTVVATYRTDADEKSVEVQVTVQDCPTRAVVAGTRQVGHDLIGVIGIPQIGEHLTRTAVGAVVRINVEPDATDWHGAKITEAHTFKGTTCTTTSDDAAVKNYLDFIVRQSYAPTNPSATFEVGVSKANLFGLVKVGAQRNAFMDTHLIIAADSFLDIIGQLGGCTVVAEHTYSCNDHVIGRHTDTTTYKVGRLLLKSGGEIRITHGDVSAR